MVLHLDGLLMLLGRGRRLARRLLLLRLLLGGKLLLLLGLRRLLLDRLLLGLVRLHRLLVLLERLHPALRWPLPDEHAEHAAVQSAGARLAIAWRSFDGQATNWRAWLSADDGRSFKLRELGSSTDDNDHPLLLRRGEQIFALWRTSQGVRVEDITP